MRSESPSLIDQLPNREITTRVGSAKCLEALDCTLDTFPVSRLFVGDDLGDRLTVLCYDDRLPPLDSGDQLGEARLSVENSKSGHSN